MPASENDAAVREKAKERERVKIRRELPKVSARIEKHPGDYDARLTLWRAGRELGMTLDELGALAGVSETAVIKALKRADDRTG